MKAHSEKNGGSAAQVRRSAGLTRAAAILLVLALVMLVITIVPFVVRWREESAAFNCALSVEKMQDLLDMEVLFRQRTLTPKETAAFLESYRERGEILCPDGGEFDAVARDSLSMEVVCCRHDSDTARRTRLCAERVLDRVRKAVRAEQLSGTAFPDSVKVTLNSRTVKAVRVEASTLLRRGTATTPGYKGIVAFYALAGEPEDVDLVRVVKAREENPEEAGSSERDSGAAEEQAVTKNAEDEGTEETVKKLSGSSDTDGTASPQTVSSETDAGTPTGSSETDAGTQAGSSETDAGTQAGSSETDAGTQADTAGKSGSIPFLPDGDAEAGEVWYFSYADENHAAGWTVGDGWRLDELRPAERNGS